MWPLWTVARSGRPCAENGWEWLMSTLLSVASRVWPMAWVPRKPRTWKLASRSAAVPTRFTRSSRRPMLKTSLPGAERSTARSTAVAEAPLASSRRRTPSLRAEVFTSVTASSAWRMAFAWVATTSSSASLTRTTAPVLRLPPYRARPVESGPRHPIAVIMRSMTSPIGPSLSSLRKYPTMPHIDPCPSPSVTELACHRLARVSQAARDRRGRRDDVGSVGLCGGSGHAKRRAGDAHDARGLSPDRIDRRRDGHQPRLQLLMPQREAQAAHLGELGLERGPVADRVRGEPLEPRAQQAAELGAAQVGDERLPRRRAMERAPPADPSDVPDVVGAGHLLDVDHLIAVEDREVDGLAGGPGEARDVLAGGRAQVDSLEGGAGEADERGSQAELVGLRIP